MISKSLTLICTLICLVVAAPQALAAPTVVLPDKSSEQPAPVDAGGTSTLDEKGLSIAYPQGDGPVHSRQPLPTKHLELQSISLRGGLFISTESPLEPIPTFGIAYVWPKLFFPKWEIGADVISGEGGVLHLGKKHMWFERTTYRPFFIWGPSLRVTPAAQLATFLDWENMMLRISIGFEDSLTPLRSIRFEIQGLFGLSEQMASFFVGHTWGF